MTIHIPGGLIVPIRLPPHVVRVTNKTGRPYLYLQKHRDTKRQTARERLPDDPESPEFWARYSELMQLPLPVKRTDTIQALIEKWHESPEWLKTSPGNKREWTRHCKRIADAWGDLEVKGLLPRHVLEFRDAWSDMPATANNMLRCLSSMLSWSVPRGWRDDNPCREVKKLKGGEPYDPWPWEVIEDAQDALRADLWHITALALYTGQRLSDVIKMRWNHIHGDVIEVKQGKTGKELLIPIHRDLRKDLDVMPRRALQILTDERGVPWTAGRFQATWSRLRPALVVEHGLVFHGLRKSAVVTLLEVECSVAEVSAITGQSIQMVQHYARKLNQEKLARSAILKWEQRTK